MSRRLWIVVLGALLLSAAGSGVGAQDFEVRAYVRPQTGITDDRPFQLIIHVEGTTSPKVTAPRIPKLENLRVASGPQQNSQFSWSNGKQAAQLQLIYTLIAVGPGLADVGPTENFGWMPGPAKWLLILLMLVGRLEVYTVLALFLPQTWKR